MISYISIDPGARTSGICEWDSEGNLMDWHEYDEDKLADYLDEIPNSVQKIIIEEYRVYSHVPHSNSKVPTIQVIGMVKYACRLKKIAVVEVRADAKKIASKWSGMPIPRGHLRDWKAAYLIGYYHLYDTKVIKSRLMREKGLA